MTRAKALSALHILPLAAVAACGDPQLQCGPGTHAQGSFCLPDGPEPGSTTTIEDTTFDPTGGGPGGWTTADPDPTTGSSVSDGPTTNSSDSSVSTTEGGCVPLECGVDVACGSVGDGCGGQLECGPCEEGTIDGIRPVRMIADRSRGRLYVTVRSDSPMHPNELVVIDPATASIVDSVFVGSDPSTMALSDDHTTLWISLEGSLQIRRVDLTTASPTPGAQHGLPPGDFDPAVAGPMVVLPGTTDSVAVSLHNYNYSPSFEGVAVLDDGVPRATKTSGHTGASRLTGGPSGWLFGYNNLHTGFGFYAIKVEAGGPTQTEHEGLVSGFYTDIVYADGRVYATSGDVVDVSNPAAPAKSGVFPFAGAVLPRLDQGRVLMLTPPDFDNNVSVLRDLDPVTFTQKQEVPLAALTADYIDDFVAPDDATLAIIAGEGFGEPPVVQIFANPFAG
ncbi:YncE family protein [Nannocystis pusilla]|uniref:Lipoprotein n=1 Tax=Nannocystis pusilla TaxID=889268 RepID=A0ABS7TWR2_9BACT|nr:hypothetical protein [Nannocystis pusilla]MBZ5712471.1 hypothetical protein [Nannocystis pusilla]